jgi:DivIVA domain-containing protein
MLVPHGESVLDVTSDEIRSSRFQGTRHVYDRREVDAFLHRVASTLEVYERRVAVTQAHVESLEKALDLAHSRARSVRDRELRIAELETALAAAQHNYESLQAELEANPPSVAPDTSSGDIAAQARRRADELVEKAAREALSIRNDAERIRTEAEEAAANLIADAEAVGMESRRTADLERTVSAGNGAAAATEPPIDLEALETRIAEARQQAEEAEAAREQLTAELEQMREEAAAERQRLMEDAEQTVAEAVAQAEIDRDRMLAQAEAELVAAREAAPAPVEDDSLAAAEAEMAGLRRQLAQMRTALSDIQARFANAADLSSEELELAAALIDLDVRDVDQLVDLTDLEDPEQADSDGEEESAAVQVKSKWAAPEEIPAGSLQDGRATSEAPPAAWRRYQPGAGKKGSHPVAPEPAAEPPKEEPLGFYERRLAGLRERLKDALPPDA